MSYNAKSVVIIMTRSEKAAWQFENRCLRQFLTFSCSVNLSYQLTNKWKISNNLIINEASCEWKLSEVIIMTRTLYEHVDSIDKLTLSVN